MCTVDVELQTSINIIISACSGECDLPHCPGNRHLESNGSGICGCLRWIYIGLNMAVLPGLRCAQMSADSNCSIYLKEKMFDKIPKRQLGVDQSGRLRCTVHGTCYEAKVFSRPGRSHSLFQVVDIQEMMCLHAPAQRVW